MLQQQLLQQQEETNRLREQIARLNQVPHANEIPPQGNPAPPVVPQVPEVRQEVPRNFEVPLAPAGMQANPPIVRENLLYELFRRMKAPEFEGLMDPIEADNWLMDIQVILDFMGLTEQERVLCASFALKKDVRKEQKEGKCYWPGQQRNYPQKNSNRGNEGNNNNDYPVCAQCGKKHLGICRLGTNACYLCGKKGHYARNCTFNNQNQNPQYPNRNASSQLHAVQAKIKDTSNA
ncbi:hypothetical protein TIFTF001_039153 [Ficus carica]|uniref:CCHC-type domain-containing protein n=1 Tax=Ficus carica TaxID=3494 RepID=A0AA88EDQ0_FICCA|nr:hypothetical protein TIFTF001_039153 [Ficus carica]